MCVLNRGVATTGQLGGPRAEATGPISTSNSVEEQSRQHHQEIPWGLPTLEDLGR